VSTRFQEFAEACTAERYIGVCFGRPGVGKTRSAREHVASPNLVHHTISKPITPETARAAEDSRGLLFTAPVSNTPKIINDRLHTNLHRFGNVRLTLAGLGEDRGYHSRVEAACPLLSVDEADRVTVASLEHLRDLYDRYGFGLIMTGMPGLEKKLARCPQLHSRIGFVREFRPLREAEMQLVARQHAATFGTAFDPASLDAVEALAAVVRITRDNLRLAERLPAQMRRIMDLNGTQAVPIDIVDAARDRLVIGPGDRQMAATEPSQIAERSTGGTA
jgi:DNA transposition AAA+ family ATPase